MSRLPHEPTPGLRQQVRSLAAHGLPQTDIGAIIGCSEKTLRLHYRQELDEGGEEANACVVGLLLNAIESRNVTAMIFYEKCKGGRHETVREEVTVTRHQPNLWLPCNGVGICHYRSPEFYFPGEEMWPPPQP